MKEIKHIELTHPKYRAEIDGLRAIAVLSVVVFHAFPSLVKGGFIGVDIFFVISGFLISTIIINSLKNSTFSFIEFYARRIKRIFPALLIMLAACAIFGWFGLLSNEYKQLGKHIAGGAGFISNFVLLKESGYFDNDSITKPLLHLWSLGIEEQFYIIFPPLLWIVWRFRQNNFIIIGFLALISFVLNIKGIKNDASLTFYSPQTRFWELLMGSLLAQFTLVRPNTLHKNFRNLETALGIILIIVGILTINQTKPFPGWLAWIPVIGAILIIHSGTDTWPNRNILSNKILVWFGLISFPLYLWHWPLLSFAHVIGRGDPRPAVKIAAICIAIILSWLTFKFVESPIRHKKYKYTTLILSILLLVMFGQGLNIYFHDGFTSRVKSFEVFNDVPLDKSPMSNQVCINQYRSFFAPEFMQKRDFCLNEGIGKKDIAMIGDSHAGKLYEAFLNMGVDNMIHIGRGSCPPIMNLNPTEEWFNCDPTINNIIHGVLKSKFELIIITGVFERYFDGYYKTGKSDLEVENIIKEYFRTLGTSNKNILIILDNPSLPFEPATCTKRPISLTDNKDCTFDRSYHDGKIGLYKNMFLKYSKDYKNIAIYDPTNLFCNSKKCYAINKEGLLYTNDYNHLSLRGSTLVNEQILKMYPEKFHFSKVR